MKYRQVKFRCAAIIQPGEYDIDNWDNTQCVETDRMHMHYDEDCDKWFCYSHWHKHLDSSEHIEIWEKKNG